MNFSKREGGGQDDITDKYVSDEEKDDFDSDRRFSNFILFAGTLALAALLMFSNVT